MNLRKQQIKITGMHCLGCEQIIHETLAALNGVKKVNVSYSAANATVEYDSDIVAIATIKQAINDKGYEVEKNESENRSPWIRFFLFAMLLVMAGGITLWGKSMMPGLLPQLNAQISNLMLFTIGLLTGFHCIGMCGGFVVSYADQSASTLKSGLAHFAFGIGKTASYTVIGALCGLLGAAISITPYMRGIAALFAGVFLLIYGLKMLNLIPSLRRFSIRLPQRFTRNVNNELTKRRNPLVLGLLTGLLLGCGPLQAMYIMAAGTGDPLKGATLLLFFSLGTLVPLLGFGFIANILSRHTIHDLVRVSGVLVIAMGLMMSNKGLKLTKSGYDFNTIWLTMQQTAQTWQKRID